MKRLIIGAIAVALLAVTPAAAVIAKEQDHKVTICHVPPGNPANAHSITISKKALKAHLGDNDEGLHGGDSYGPCKPSSTPAPTPTATASTPSPTASPSPTPSPTPEPTTTPSPSPEPTSTPTPAPSASPSETPTCDLPEGCGRPTPEVTLPPTDTEG